MSVDSKALGTAAELERLTSPALSDVLDGENCWGVLSWRIRRLSGARRTVFGRAYTVQWRPARKSSDIRSAASTWDEVKAFLVPDVHAGRGRVYVAGAGDIMESMALAGGLSATHFENIGFEGLVLGGAIRDAHVLMRRDLPVFATHFVPSDSAGAFVVSEVGTRCLIGDVEIRTGDFVFADDSGVVRLPADRAEFMIREALRVLDDEEKVMRKLERGEDISRILATEGRI